MRFLEAGEAYTRLRTLEARSMREPGKRWERYAGSIDWAERRRQRKIAKAKAEKKAARKRRKKS